MGTSINMMVFVVFIFLNTMNGQGLKDFSLDANSGLPIYFPLAKKDFIRMSSHYGYRVHPIKGRIKKHMGLDLVAKMGKPVYASADGKVITHDYHSSYGVRVILKHAHGIKTLYGHLLLSGLRKNQYVKAGQVIGYVGSTGQTTGPHLHYEIWINSKKVNPVDFWSRFIAKNNKVTTVY